MRKIFLSSIVLSFFTLVSCSNTSEKSIIQARDDGKTSPQIVTQSQDENKDTANGNQDATSGVKINEGLSINDGNIENIGNKEAYMSLSTEEFLEMQKNKDFFLIDTHIPEQEHITGTDAFIPYNEIAYNLQKLPEDKNTKIVLYCRSGYMSRKAADVLNSNGYTNLYNLTDGKVIYDLRTKK